jgi:hypothetical protein
VADEKPFKIIMHSMCLNAWTSISIVLLILSTPKKKDDERGEMLSHFSLSSSSSPVFLLIWSE